MNGWGDCLERIGNTGEEVATLRCIPILMKNVVNGFFLFSGSTALFLIIWAAIMLLNSGGDAKKIESARKILTYAILGLVLILLSFTIVNFVSFVSGVPCIRFDAVGFDTCP